MPEAPVPMTMGAVALVFAGEDKHTGSVNSMVVVHVQ